MMDDSKIRQFASTILGINPLLVDDINDIIEAINRGTDEGYFSDNDDTRNAGRVVELLERLAK